MTFTPPPLPDTTLWDIANCRGTVRQFAAGDTGGSIPGADTASATTTTDVPMLLLPTGTVLGLQTSLVAADTENYTAWLPSSITVDTYTELEVDGNKYQVVGSGSVLAEVDGVQQVQVTLSAAR